MTPNASWDQCKALAEKHTDGPWVLIGSHPNEGFDCWWVRAQPSPALRGFTKDIAAITGPQASDEQAANAHLIAAAPELLEALDLMVAVSRSTAGFSPMIRQQAEAALAKARGQS